MGKFKGFKTLFPTYSIICPQTGHQFQVRGLNVSEVSSIRESIITQNKIAENIATILWNAIQTKPDDINTYDDFIRMTTLKDRNALIYGLYILTFGETRQFSGTCPKCETTQTMNINLPECFSINSYPGNEVVKDSYRVSKLLNGSHDDDIEKAIEETEISITKHPAEIDLEKGIPEEIVKNDYPEYFENLKKQEDEESTTKSKSKKSKKIKELTDQPKYTSILDKVIPIQLDKLPNIIVYLFQPTLYDELEHTKNLALLSSTDIDAASEALFIQKIEEYNDDKTLYQTIDDRIDIVEAFKQLPNTDSEKISKTYFEEFGQYEIKITGVLQCSKCNNKNNIEVDVVTQFFRAFISNQ